LLNLNFFGIGLTKVYVFYRLFKLKLKMILIIQSAFINLTNSKLKVYMFEGAMLKF